MFPTRRGERMTRQAFWHIIKRYARKACVNRDLSPHTLQARLCDPFAQLPPRTCGSCKCCFGHSDLSTTQIYTHVAARAYASASTRSTIRAADGVIGPPRWLRLLWRWLYEAAFIPRNVAAFAACAALSAAVLAGGAVAVCAWCNDAGAGPSCPCSNVAGVATGHVFARWPRWHCTHADTRNRRGALAVPISVYMSRDGKYVIAGDLFKVASHEDLTEVHRRELRRKLIDAVPESQMVVFSPPDPKYTVTVFTDVDCAYCRALHGQINDYNRLGIKVRYVFFPRTGPNTSSWYKAEQVWCSTDRRNGANAVPSLGEVLPAAKLCGHTPGGARIRPRPGDWPCGHAWDHRGRMVLWSEATCRPTHYWWRRRTAPRPPPRSSRRAWRLT